LAMIALCQQHCQQHVHVDRSSVARDKIKTTLMCRGAARIDRMVRVTVLPNKSRGCYCLR
jgi:hypothetical protein